MMTQLPSLCILKNRHVLDLHRQLEIFNELQRRIQKIIQKEGGRPPPPRPCPKWKRHFSGHAAYSVMGVLVMQSKGPGKRRHIVADTLLPKQMFPRLPARATFVAEIYFVSGTQKMFLILFRNILCPQQMFPSLRSPRNIIGNNVSATMWSHLPGP